MNIQTINVDSCAATGIAIGRRGSYDTQQIVFDLSALIAEYGNGSAALLILRPTDTTPYPATATQSGTELTWTVSATDTAIPGAGECELFWYVDGGLAKSVIYPLIITEDIIGTDVPAPPDPYETWIEELTALGAETLENAQNAAQSATAAAASETAAAQSTTNAEEAAEEAASSEEAATSAKNDAISAKNSAEASKNAAGEYSASAATSAASAATSATNAATAAETATAKATQAAASAAAAAAGAGSASDDAAIATAQANGAKASATTAAGSASTAIVKAGEAAASAVAAAISATDSAASASASSGSASAASAKATEAAASASAASGKATEAANSATAAVNAQTGAEAAQAASEAAQQAAEEAAQEAQTILVDKAPVITDTATGAIASFPDGSDGLPLKYLVASIEPVQDLHGYDSPWPGGGGKNKWSLGDITENASGTPFELPAGTYTFSCTPSVSTALFAVRFFYADDTSKLVGVSSSNNFTQTVTFTADVVKVNRSATGGTATNVQLESGSSKTTFAPYSNICPISGWTGLEGQRTGKNQADLSSMINVGWTRIIDNPCKDGGYYTFSVESQILVNNVAGCGVFLTNDNTSGSGGVQIIPYQFGDSVMSYTINIPVGYRYLRFGLRAGGATVATFETAKLQIEKGGTKTAYEAPQIETLSVSWQDTAGTVYGGSMTVEDDGSGVLNREWKDVDMGSLRWALNVSGQFFATLSDADKGVPDVTGATAKCSNYKSGNAYDGSEDYVVCVNGAATSRVWVKDSNYGSASSFKTAMSGVQLVYELAEPPTYHFDNLEQLTTVLGTNNIWVDTGDVQCEYRADTKLFLEKLTAPTEDDMIANANIAANKFFMVGNNLYLSTAAIAQGATIVPGTNCTLTNLADALNTLNS